MLDLAFPNQNLHSARNIFNRHIQVHTMLVEQIDGIDFEPFERALRGPLDMLPPAVECAPFATVIRISPIIDRRSP
jgi:hypothetical protein